MKLFFQLLFAAAILFDSVGFAQTDHLHDQPSVHGMLIVGKSKIYLSHLPMFHSPHDYQVILEASLSEEGEAAYLTSVAAGDESVYTLVPDAFVLPEMVQNPKPFLAKIYKGHFERGGVVIATRVAVEIRNILYFKKFALQEVKPDSGSYLLFGDKSEQFLAHVIVAKPDFDQLLKVTPTKESTGFLGGKNLVSVNFNTLKNTDPIAAPSTLSAETGASTSNFMIPIESSIYLESGDLSF